MNLIVKTDYNEIDDENDKFKLNNTFEQKKNENIDEKYHYISIENCDNNKDKYSDNEYFMMKHNKLNKNLTRALIEEESENDKKSNNNENKNKEKKSDNENEENENENYEVDKNNKSKSKNSYNDNDNDNGNEKENNSENNNQEENKNDSNSQEDIESICITENNETSNN